MNTNEILLSQESYELLKYIMSHPQFFYCRKHVFFRGLFKTTT